MSRYDIVETAVIDAPPQLVWAELLAEFRGGGRWWVPHNTFVARTEPIDRPGGEVDITVHTRGVDRRGLKLRFTARTRAVEPGRSLTVDYVAGGFRGWSTFTVEPIVGGGTRVSMHWKADPHGWVRGLAKVVDMGKEHSKATSDAFANLAIVLGGERQLGRPA